MKRRIAAVFILSMFFALSACESGHEPKEPNASGEETSDPNPSVIDIRESDEMIATEKFKEPETSDSLVKNELDNDPIIDRVISRFQDQCLEWYYSDCLISCDHEVLDGRVYDSPWYIHLDPGTKLYYRIQTTQKHTGYKIFCSDDESFRHSFGWVYAYFPHIDCITQIDHGFTFEPEYRSGSFSIPESYSSDNEENDLECRTLFDSFWNEWLTEKASEELESPIKNAYLMPFKTEDDGSATFRVYIEEENGVWILARATAQLGQPASATKKLDGVSWGDMLFGNYTFSPFQWFEEEAADYRNEHIAEDGELVVARVYLPSDSDYSVYTYELYRPMEAPDDDPNDHHLYGHVSSKDTGDFLSVVPDLALTKLPQKTDK